MTLPPENTDTLAAPPPPPRPRRRKRGGWSLRLTAGGLLLLMTLNLVILALLAWPVLRYQAQFFNEIARPAGQTSRSATPSQNLPASATPTASATAPAASTLTPSATPSPRPTQSDPLLAASPLSLKNGVIFLSLAEGAETHIFAYAPEALPLTRLSSGPWEDTAPAISPDGQRLAFASNRNGYWDLYLLELASGEVTRLTDTPEYEGAPSWSPDGAWLVYEQYANQNLEIFIRPVAGDQSPIQLTSDDASDHSPVWSPGGRQIAFVSTRSGEAEIWLADLDTPGEGRFRNISQNLRARESHPAWSPDGSRLAYASVEDGIRRLLLWDTAPTAENPLVIGGGDWPVWSQDGATLLALLQTPSQAYLTGYTLDAPGLAVPPLPVPAPVLGLTWGANDFPRPLPEAYRAAVVQTPLPAFTPALTPATDLPPSRQRVVALPGDIQAPYASLHDAVDEAFIALRQHIAAETGWDFLYTLENAFVPITTPLGPGLGQDWLYTGRAFAFNIQPLYAGWLAVVREDFGGETYWRIYLRTQFQDGSAGAPLKDLPWDFNARLNGSTSAYEDGGALAGDVPAGYWLDLTRHAQIFGWERLPALPLWRTAFPLARFNEFAQSAGLTWRAAMLELYPPEALITPSPVIPPTRTPTRTPRWFQTDTPTPSPTPRPTLTPITPTQTATLTPTITPTVTRTIRPTPTRTLKAP